MNACENCNATIGKLETPMVWKDHVVCAKCHASLSGETLLLGSVYPIQTREVSSPLQIKSAVAACVGVVMLIVGVWMLNAANQSGHYDYLKTPGELLLIVGIVATAGGMLAFAYERMR